MRIIVNRKNCTGCHLCELVCSVSHLGITNTEKSAIRVRKDDLDTSLNKPSVCLQCSEMPCLDGEDVDVQQVQKQFVWPRQRAERCPFDCLTVFGLEAYHCDLCGGRPRCVDVCTSGALRTKP